MSDERTNDAGGQMVPWAEPDAATKALATWDGQRAAFRTSLDLTTNAGRAKLFKLTATGDLNGSTIGNRAVKVVDWMVSFSDGFENDDGEMISGLRLALLLDDGTSFHTFSPVAIKDWGWVIRLYGSGPWTPPIKVEFASRPRRKGPGAYLQIIGAMQDDPPAKRK